MKSLRSRALLGVMLLAGLLQLAGADTQPAGGSSSGGQKASADPATPAGPEAQIPFADHGNIYDWQVVDNKTVLIQTQAHKWYKATLMSACFELPFTEHLGFQSNPDGSFDKFSTIEVRGQTCPLVSLVETAPPARKPKAKNNKP